jgi:hypothetical protein
VTSSGDTIPSTSNFWLILAGVAAATVRWRTPTHSSAAVAVLEQTALALQDQSKSQAVVLGNLALAHIRQDSREAAVARLHQAIDVTERNRGGGGLNVIFGAGRELRRWRQSSEVQDVYDRILTLMAA